MRSDGQGGLSDRRLSPPPLSRAFSRLDNSRVVRSGYVFQVFLPDGNGGWLAEAPTGGAEGIAVDPGDASAHWCAYAWPAEYGVTGGRAFFINERGEVLAADNAGGRYSGPDKPISSDAAFVNGHAAINAVGGDGERWIVVN